MLKPVLPVLFVIVLLGCGSNKGGVNGTASFYNGPTPSATARTLGGGRGGGGADTLRMARALSGPTEGNWLISPDKMTLTLTQITLSGAEHGSTSNVNCPITYDLSQVGLAKLVDCPFEADPGTYNTLLLSFDSTYQVLIDDATNSIYSTASGLTGSAPAGGAQFFTVTTGSSGSTFGNTSYIRPAITVNQGDSISLSIVINGLQFFRAHVSSGGQIGLGLTSDHTPNDPFRPDMTGGVGTVAKLGYYVIPEIGTALSYNRSLVDLPLGVTSVAVYYSSATTPTTLFTNLNDTPAGCTIGAGGVINGSPSGGHGGGYLGLDASSGTLAWAEPTDSNWTSYGSVMTMAQATTLGATTTLKCKPTSADPAPSGGVFSTAPDMTNPTYTQTLKLVAE